MTAARRRPSLAAVTRAVGRPPEDWPALAGALPRAILAADLARGSAVTGRWVGPIAHASPFIARRAADGVAHHWIELPDGGILDPLRWALEADPPYVYLAPSPDFTIDYAAHFAIDYVAPVPTCPKGPA